MSGVTEKLRTEIGYDAMEDVPIDTLIAYKDALEELVDAVDEAMRSNAGKTDYRMSAADITGMLYSMGFGA